MDFNCVDWADSDIEKITIEHDCAQLHIFCDALQKNVCVRCTGFVGLTDLCIWDDQIIDSAGLRRLTDDEEIPFVRKVFSAYDRDLNSGERRLNKGLLEMRVRLSNGITFQLYCQKVEVLE